MAQHMPGWLLTACVSHVGTKQSSASVHPHTPPGAPCSWGLSAQQKSGACSVRRWDLKTGSLLLGTSMPRAGGSKGERREQATHLHTPSPRPEGRCPGPRCSTPSLRGC